MKTLNHHVLIYDKDCPMCNLYTSAFIKTKMLDENGRVDFCSINFKDYPEIDIARSRDEIALVNKKTGDITYGIESLFKILSNRFSALNLLFNNLLFRKVMTKCYAFISFNRKVIAPAKNFELAGSCTPSFHLTYRLVYILLSWIFTSIILNQYALRLTPIVPATNFIREWVICGGQIIFQTAFVVLINRARLIHYLGNMMTVSNIGALLLILALLLPTHNPLIFISWFSVVVSFMLYEHSRRCTILELPIWVSLSWVIHRLLILLIIYSI